MSVQTLSPLGLYADRAFFQVMLDHGCDQLQSGRGPWIGEECVVHIFCFLKAGKIVAALETVKSYVDDVHGRRGRNEKNWPTEKEAKAYLQKWQISLGKKGNLRELVELWDTP